MADQDKYSNRSPNHEHLSSEAKWDGSENHLGSKLKLAFLARRYCGWIVVAAILALAGMLWTTGKINAAGQTTKAKAAVSMVAALPAAVGEAEVSAAESKVEEPNEDEEAGGDEDAGKGVEEPNEKADDSVKDVEEAGKDVEEPNKGGEEVEKDEEVEKGDEAVGEVKEAEKDAEAEKLKEEMEAVEKEIFDLFDKYAEASEKDPDSEETKALEKAMDDVIAKHQKMMEQVYEIEASKLPAEPADKAGVDPKESRVGAPKPVVAPKPPVKQPVKPVVKPEEKTPDKPAEPAKPAVSPEESVQAEEPVEPVEVVAGQAGGQGVVTEISTAPAGVDVSDVSQGVKVGTGKGEISESEPSPDDIVKIKMEENLVDIAQLIETIGIELKFNFLYDNTEPIAGKVLLQQHGEIRRRDLLPLLEGLLKFKDYVMVREDPFIRITKRVGVEASARPLISIGSGMPEVKPGDSIMTQIIEIKYVPVQEMITLLGKFTDAKSLSRISNTNYLIITDYVKQMPRLLEIIALVDRPGPSRNITILEVEYLDAKSVKSEIETLVKALAGEVSDAAGAKPAAPVRPVLKPGEKPGVKPKVETEDAISAAKVPEYFIYVDERTNRLIVISTEEQAKQITELLAMLDVEVGGPEIVLVPLEVKHIKASSANTQIVALLKSLNEQGGAAVSGQQQPSVTARRPPVPRPSTRPPTGSAATDSKIEEKADKGPYLHVDDRTNRLLVVGSAEQIDQVKELLSLLDVVEGPEIKLEVIRVEHVEADGVSSKIESIIEALNEQGATSTSSAERGGVTAGRTPAKPPAGQKEPAPSQTSVGLENRGPVIFVDERTNRLFVVGSDEQIVQVKELLALLDVEEGPEIKLVAIRVEYVMADEVASQIEDLIEALNEQGGAGSLTMRGQSGRSQSFRGSRAASVPAGGAAAAKLPAAGSVATGREAEVSGVLEVGPAIFVDERTNRLLIVGSDDQMEQVRELLALLDVPEGPEIKLEVIKVEYVLADEVASQVEELIEALYEHGAQGISDRPRSTGRNQISQRSVNQPAASPGQREVQPGARESRTNRTGRGDAQSGGSEYQGPAIFVDERTNRMLVVGSEEQIEQVQELLALLDVPEGPEIKLEVIKVEHVLAGDVAGQVEDLIEALYEQGAQGISGRPRNAGRDQVLQRQMNQPATVPGQREVQSGARETRTNRAGRGESRSGRSEYQGPAIFVDERTNRMLVVGSEEQIVQVKQLLGLLDVEKGPAIRLAAIDVHYVLADEVSNQLQELFDALADQSGSVTRAQTSVTGRSSRTSNDTFSNRSGTRTGEDNTTRLGEVENARSRRSSSRRSGSGESVNPGPFIMVDVRTNRLLVVGSEEHIKECENLLTVLDVPPSEYHKLHLRIYQPEYVEAAEVQKILDELGITKPETMAPRDRARQGEGLVPTAGVSRISSTVGGESLSTGPEKVFSVTGEGGQILPGQEEPEVRVAIQETTNRIFILATEYQLNDIEEILKNVDIEPRADMNAIQIYPLKNRDPEVVAEMLKQLLIDPIEKEISEGQSVMVPGREDAPVIVPFTDIYAIGVRGSKQRQEEIKLLIEALDKRKPQVLLEAILVQVNASDALKLGIALQQAWDPGGARNTNRTFSTSSPFGISATRAGSIVSGSGGTLAFFDDDLVFATLEALQTEGDSKITSMPRVLVNHNETGSITNQRSEPTTRTTVPAGSDTPIIEFNNYVDAGTMLEIKPLIGEGGLLELEISMDVSSFDGLGTENVPPPRSENKIATKVMVPNGKYIILGGLTSRTNSLDVNKVPILGDIPIIGALFQSVARSESDAVLYIFVRANIVQEDSFADLYNVTEKYKKRLRESEINYDEQSAETLPGVPDRRLKVQRTLEDE